MSVVSMTPSVCSHCHQQTKCKDGQRKPSNNNNRALSLYVLLVICSFITLPFGIVFTVLATFVCTALIYTKQWPTTAEIVPKMCFKESALTKHLLRKCRRLRRPYRPTLLGCNGHIQTLVRVFVPTPQLLFTREYLQMKDEGVVALDWLIKPVARIRRSRLTVLVVLLGHGGSYKTCGCLCRDSAAYGFQVVVFNKRGHGDSMLTTPKLASFGDPTDLRQAIKYIRAKYPKSNIAAIATGAGTDLLFSYLGEYGSSSYVKAAACISPTYEITQGYNSHSNNCVSSIYNYIALLEMKRLLHKHAKALSSVIDLPSAFNASTLSEFTERVYGRLNGYSNAADFWEKNNPLRDVDDIAVPVLCINSLDDPLYSQSDIPFELFKCSPNFFLVTTDRGGHCGFMENSWAKSWAESLSLEYIEVALEFVTIHGDR